MLAGGNKIKSRASGLAAVSALCLGWSQATAAQDGTPGADDAATAARTDDSGVVAFSVPLTFSGGALSDVIVQISPDESVAIESQTLRSALQPLLNPLGIERLDMAIAGDPFVLPGELSRAGIEVGFDLAQLQLDVLSIAGDLRPVQSLGRGSPETDQERELQPTIQPAGFSAFLNTSVNLTYNDGSDTPPPDLFLFGAARFQNVVLEIDGGFSEASGDGYSFYRRTLRAVYDEPEKFRRWSAGDLLLENGNLLVSPVIGGLAVEKGRRNFNSFTRPLRLSGREIQVTTPSTVEVLVNGAPFQTLELQPGTYSLDDLPIRLGTNDVELRVRDASGREQITRFDYFFEPFELPAGEEEYTFAFGAIADRFGFEPSYTDDLAFIGNYRRALNDLLILGGGVQLSESLQVASIETQIVPQIFPGASDFQAAMSTGEGTGFAARGGYRVIFGQNGENRLSASIDYESASFQTVGDLSDFRLENLSATAAFSRVVSQRASVVVGGTYFTSGAGRSQSNLFADLTYRLRDNISANAGLEYGTGSFGPNFGIRVGISILLGQRHRADADYRSRRETARASISRGTDNSVGSFGYAVNLQDSQGQTSVDGIVDYIGNRFEARASLGTSGPQFGDFTRNQTARLRVGSSFAFADGAFGIGRPIQDAFIVAKPHEALEGTDIIIGRNLNRGDYDAASGTLGGAVASRLGSYNTQDVQYDVDTLDAGYAIGSGVERLYPPFRAGYALEVGTDRFVSAVGFLEIGGEPAKLVVGVISSSDDPGFEPQPFFTNSGGRFGILGLAPGRTYDIRLNSNGRTFSLAIPEGNKGLYRADTIDLPAE